MHKNTWWMDLEPWGYPSLLVIDLELLHCGWYAL